MPDEYGFATPEERGDFLPEDTDGREDADSNAGDAGSAASDDGNAASAAAGNGSSGGSDDQSADGATDAAATTEDAETSTEDASGDDVSAAAAEDTQDSADTEGGATEETAETSESERAPDRSGTLIPKVRFDQTNIRLKEAREEIARLTELVKGGGEKPDAEEATTEKPPTIEDIVGQLQAKNTEVAEALKDGDSEKIAQLLAEAQDLQNQIVTSHVEGVAVTQQNLTREQLEYDKTVATVEAQYPFVNPESEAYDQGKVDEVSELFNDFIQAGRSRSEALLKAITLLHPVADQEPQKKGEPAKRKTDVKKNVAAANKQPPQVGDAGEDSTKLGMQKEIDVTKLSDDEFDKLSKEELKRLRGDFL